MAGRSYKKNFQSLDAQPVLVRCAITIGGAGAVSSFVGPEVLSVVHTGAGVYTVTFTDKFPAAPLVVIPGAVQQATPTGVNMTIASMTTNSVVLNTALTTLPGTVADPASGTVLSFIAYFNNTSMPF